MRRLAVLLLLVAVAAGRATFKGGHDLSLLAENRDVYFVPAAASER